jgi:cell division protein FtsL
MSEDENKKIRRKEKMDRVSESFQKKVSGFSESQKMIIAVAGTTVIVVLVVLVFSFLNSLISVIG